MLRTTPWIFVAAALLAGDVRAEAPRKGGDPLSPPTLSFAGPRAPWRARRRTGVTGMRGRGQGLLALSQWPAEPESPKHPDEQRLAAALRQICGWMPPRRPLRYARWLLRHGAEFGVDPFLLGALIYRQSMCLPQADGDYGIGLSRIHEAMHRPFIRGRRYHYWVLDAETRWQPRQLDISRFLFYPRNLRRAEPSIYFAAALLSIYAKQCPAIDGAFASVPHRHSVSHVVWGDRVRGAGAEDRVLRARRRLLQYYHGALPAVRARFEAVPLACPLDGPPRKITSVMGDDRIDGRRRHRGIDFSSTAAEPVRAVADGRVVIAGVDRPRGPPLNLAPEAGRAYERSRMGPGGLFVMIVHDGGLRSAYMHLMDYQVTQGDAVRTGQVIGHVGKSGIRESAAHLHFELRHGGRHIDPAIYLHPYLLLPQQTYLGQRLAAEQQRVRKRRQRRQARERSAGATATPDG